MNRHTARTITFQALFIADMRGATADDIPEIVAFLVDEIHQNPDKTSERRNQIIHSCQSVLRKTPTIDEIITRAAPKWPVDKIAVVDRNILRLGLYELLFSDQEKVPYRVAINEAIEIAKKFGGGQSSRFINGVLGAVYRELDDDDDSPPTLKKNPTDEPSQIEERVGGIVFHRGDDGKVFFCLVHDIFGYWTLPKGSARYTDDLEQSVREKIYEETNQDVVLLKKVSENTYPVHHPEKGHIMRHVVYFLSSTDMTEPSVNRTTGGIDAAQWFSRDQIDDLPIYPDVRDILLGALPEIEMVVTH